MHTTTVGSCRRLTTTLLASAAVIAGTLTITPSGVGAAPLAPQATTCVREVSAALRQSRGALAMSQALMTEGKEAAAVYRWLSQRISEDRDAGTERYRMAIILRLRNLDLMPRWTRSQQRAMRGPSLNLDYTWLTIFRGMSRQLAGQISLHYGIAVLAPELIEDWGDHAGTFAARLHAAAVAANTRASSAGSCLPRARAEISRTTETAAAIARFFASLHDR